MSCRRESRSLGCHSLLPTEDSNRVWEQGGDDVPITTSTKSTDKESPHINDDNGGGKRIVKDVMVCMHKGKEEERKRGRKDVKDGNGNKQDDPQCINENFQGGSGGMTSK